MAWAQHELLWLFGAGKTWVSIKQVSHLLLEPSENLSHGRPTVQRLEALRAAPSPRLWGKPCCCPVPVTMSPCHSENPAQSSDPSPLHLHPTRPATSCGC